jgi:hypothetical protein
MAMLSSNFFPCSNSMKANLSFSFWKTAHNQCFFIFSVFWFQKFGNFSKKMAFFYQIYTCKTKITNFLQILLLPSGKNSPKKKESLPRAMSIIISIENLSIVTISVNLNRKWQGYRGFRSDYKYKSWKEKEETPTLDNIGKSGERQHRNNGTAICMYSDLKWQHLQYWPINIPSELTSSWKWCKSMSNSTQHNKLLSQDRQQQEGSLILLRVSTKHKTEEDD